MKLQMRYRLKHKYFNGISANQVRTTSPISNMSDNEWRKLVEKLSAPNHKVLAIDHSINYTGFFDLLDISY